MIKNINNINIYKYYNNNKKYDTNTKKRPSSPTVPSSLPALLKNLF